MRNRRPLRPLLVSLFFVGNLANLHDAEAQSIPARTGWYYRDMALVRVNPLGLFEELRIGYRYGLYQDPSAKLLKGSYISTTVNAAITPALFRVGPMVEIAPLAILQVYAGVDFFSYFGSFGSLSSFSSPRADYRDEVLRNNQSNDVNYASIGSVLTIGARLQAKVGPVALRWQGQAIRYDMRLRNNHQVFYDVFFDLLVPNKHFLTTHDIDLLWLGRSGLTLGTRFSLVTTKYADSAFATGEAKQQDNVPLYRLGPLFSYRLFKDDRAALNDPTVFVLAQWWLKHRYRAGQDISRALPQIIAGVSFRGEFL